VKSAATDRLAGLAMSGRSVQTVGYFTAGHLLLSIAGPLQGRTGMKLMQFRYNDCRAGIRRDSAAP
jgi:hypothetical protein